MLAELSGGLELGGGAGGDAGFIVVYLVKGVLDFPTELAGGFQFGQRGLEFAGLRLEGGRIGGGFGRRGQGGECLFGALKFGLQGRTGAFKLGRPGLGGVDLFLQAEAGRADGLGVSLDFRGLPGEAIAIGAHGEQIGGDFPDLGGVGITLLAQARHSRILGGVGAGRPSRARRGRLAFHDGGAGRSRGFGGGENRGCHSEGGLAFGDALPGEFQ